MSDVSLMGYWGCRFLLEHLVGERNLARNTQRSYRDTLTLLFPFMTGKLNRPVDRLTVLHVSADLVRLFLLDLEGVASVRNLNPKPAARGCPRVGSIRRRAQSGTHSLVQSASCNPFQENDEARHPVSGKTGDGCTAVLPKSPNLRRLRRMTQ